MTQQQSLHLRTSLIVVLTVFIVLINTVVSATTINNNHHIRTTQTNANHIQRTRQLQTNEEETCGSITGFSVYDVRTNTHVPIQTKYLQNYPNIGNPNNINITQYPLGRVVVDQYNESKINIIAETSNTDTCTNGQVIKCVQIQLGNVHTIQTSIQPYTLFRDKKYNNTVSLFVTKMGGNKTGYSSLVATSYNTSNCLIGSEIHSKQITIHIVSKLIRNYPLLPIITIQYNNINTNLIASHHINPIVIASCRYIRQALIDTYTIQNSLKFEKLGCWRETSLLNNNNTTTTQQQPFTNTISYKLFPTISINKDSNNYWGGSDIDLPTNTTIYNYILKLFNNDITIFSKPYEYISDRIKNDIELTNPFYNYTSITIL